MSMQQPRPQRVPTVVADLPAPLHAIRRSTGGRRPPPRPPRSPVRGR
jgi:hypothetical protein